MIEWDHRCICVFISLYRGSHHGHNTTQTERCSETQGGCWGSTMSNWHTPVADSWDWNQQRCHADHNHYHFKKPEKVQIFVMICFVMFAKLILIKLRIGARKIKMEQVEIEVEWMCLRKPRRQWNWHNVQQNQRWYLPLIMSLESENSLLHWNSFLLTAERRRLKKRKSPSPLMFSGKYMKKKIWRKTKSLLSLWATQILSCCCCQISN